MFLFCSSAPDFASILFMESGVQVNTAQQGMKSKAKNKAMAAATFLVKTPTQKLGGKHYF